MDYQQISIKRNWVVSGIKLKSLPLLNSTELQLLEGLSSIIADLPKIKSYIFQTLKQCNIQISKESNKGIFVEKYYCIRDKIVQNNNTQPQVIKLGSPRFNVPKKRVLGWVVKNIINRIVPRRSSVVENTPPPLMKEDEMLDIVRSYHTLLDELGTEYEKNYDMRIDNIHIKRSMTVLLLLTKGSINDNCKGPL